MDYYHPGYIGIIFTRSPSFEGMITRTLTDFEYDHCAIICDDTYCIDASYGDPVERRRIDKLLDDRPGSLILYWVAPSEANAQHFLSEQIGKGYDKIGRWSCVLPFNLADDRPWEIDDGFWFCSRLAMNTLERGAYVGRKPKAPEHSSSPKTVFETYIPSNDPF